MLGEKMKLIRNYNGYSQRQIAEILKIERSTYASYETGRNRPDIFAVQRFAKIFNVSVDYILSLDDINIYRLRDQATDYAKRHKKESVISQLSSDEKILIGLYRQCDAGTKKSILEDVRKAELENRRIMKFVRGKI